MANIKAALGGTTAITCTLTSVAVAGSREATVVNNTANLYTDAQMMVKIQVTAIPNGGIWVTLDSSLDNTNFTSPATGADANITIPNVDVFSSEIQGQEHSGTNLRVVGKVTPGTAITATGTIISNIGSVAQIYGGGNQLPPFWAPVFTNLLNAALGATAASHVIWYDGDSFTSI